MSQATTNTAMTAEAFAAWADRPENERKWLELVRGEVLEWPTPGRIHGVVCASVSWILGNYVRQHRRGFACQGAGFIVERNPDTVRGPDVAIYHNVQRFADLPATYDEVPPLLAVEVLSPEDPAGKVIEKLNDYLRCGVCLVWVLDPTRRSVTVFQPDASLANFNETQELTGGTVLPDFRCRVVDFFLLPSEASKGRE